MTNRVAYVGTAVFWTTRCENLAASQGWALTACEDNKRTSYAITRHFDGVMQQYVTDFSAEEAVRTRAKSGEAVALLALAIVAASAEEISEDVPATASRLFTEGFLSGRGQAAL